MESSDFGLVLDALNAKPGMTGREVATYLRTRGHNRFTSTLANQVLYRLLATSMVECDTTGYRPRWRTSNSWAPKNSAASLKPVAKRPLAITDQPIKKYLVASTEVRVLLDQQMSPNDPYVSTDWVGPHVVASVNLKHPFWTLRLDGLKDEALYCMFVAVDAYVQWKVAQLHEPPDAREVQKMRDFALRYCTLAESDQIMSDQRTDASRRP